MLQVALAQVRQHARRFIAVGLAVVMAVGFLTATLMVNASTEASLGNSIGATFPQRRPGGFGGPGQAAGWLRAGCSDRSGGRGRGVRAPAGIHRFRLRRRCQLRHLAEHRAGRAGKPGAAGRRLAGRWRGGRGRRNRGETGAVRGRQAGTGSAGRHGRRRGRGCCRDRADGRRHRQTVQGPVHDGPASALRHRRPAAAAGGRGQHVAAKHPV